jgi:hypothetical protein
LGHHSCGCQRAPRPRAGLERERCGPLEEGSCRRQPATRLRALGAPLKLGCNPLIGSGRGLGEVPRAAVGIELCVGRLRQRVMGLSPLLR